MWNKDPSYYWLSTRFVTKSIWLLTHSHKICLAFWILNMISKVSISIFWGSHPCSPHVLNPASHSTPQQIEKTGQTPDKTKRLFKLIKTQGLGKTQEVIAENGKKNFHTEHQLSIHTFLKSYQAREPTRNYFIIYNHVTFTSNWPF